MSQQQIITCIIGHDLQGYGAKLLFFNILVAIFVKYAGVF